MINLNDFLNILKDEGQYGTRNVITDTPTAQLLNSANKRGARIWGFADWKWIMEPLSIPVTPNTNSYLVIATSGNPIDRIHTLIPHDPTTSPPTLGKPLDEMEIEDFYEQTQRQFPNIPDIPTKYCNLGMNAAFQWQIMIAPTPSIAFTMTGYAKAVLYTYLQSDVVANTPFAYFPNGVVLDALFDGCMIDVMALKGASVADRLQAEAAWVSKLTKLKTEQIGVARDNSSVATPPPPWWAARNRARSKKGTGVY